MIPPVTAVMYHHIHTEQVSEFCRQESTTSNKCIQQKFNVNCESAVVQSTLSQLGISSLDIVFGVAYLLLQLAYKGNLTFNLSLNKFKQKSNN